MAEDAEDNRLANVHNHGNNREHNPDEEMLKMRTGTSALGVQQKQSSKVRV